MYNSITEEKIKNIPKVGEINIERLPQELTRIYAQVVSLRRQLNDGTINFQDEKLISALNLLWTLSNNLEVLLLSNPEDEHKESIAFVAAVANSLIHKMELMQDNNENHLSYDNISTYIATVLLFLIGNSQADAAETARSINNLHTENLTQQRLIASIISLATGGLADISESNFNEKEISRETNLEEIALNFLWREVGLGIVDMSNRLLGKPTELEQNRFNTVLELTVSEPLLYKQRSIIAGPYRLAKLLKILEKDIFDRAVITIPPPINVDSNLWKSFLGKLATERPYLWENHKDAVKTNFLNEGVSSVLTLPTGAGKSTLSELKIASCLYSKKRVIYLVPTHALEDQVNNNLRKIFKEFDFIDLDIGGEFTEINDLYSFPIVVMTPERCLTLINTNPEFFVGIGLVVFDEFHLIHGTNPKKDRRSLDAMHCLLMLFAIVPCADYLLISAMVENGEEICSWIEKVTGRECKLFSSSWKPTRQLHGCLVFEEEKIRELQEIIKTFHKNKTTKTPPAKLRRELIITPNCFFSLKNIWETTNDYDYFKTEIFNQKIALGINNWWKLTSNRNKIAADLAIHFARLGLKTLVFVDQPRKTISTARIISDSLEQKTNIQDKIISENPLIHSLELELGDLEHSYIYDHQTVGIHHGLLLPTERIIIENLFKDPHGSIVLVATATLAQGINLPAEVVIIAGDDRYDADGGGMEKINPHELLNAAGRAGRAGLSAQGAVILIPGDIVTIENNNISNRWWELKKDVFSKGDQCLEIQDPLEYLLDSLQEDTEMNSEYTNILYRFKPEKLDEKSTRQILRNSFYAYQIEKKNELELFENQIKILLNKRNELDQMEEDYVWQKEIGIKTGLEPHIILELGKAIDLEEFEDLISKEITDLIDWFINWLCSDQGHIIKMFTKESTIQQLKKAVGLPMDSEVSEIPGKLNILSEILKSYVKGIPLHELDKIIPNAKADNSKYLIKARNFVNRLIPELSYSFGVLSLVLTDKSLKKGQSKKQIPLNIKMLSSCIREGFDSSDKLFYKINEKIPMRVETHIKFTLHNSV